MRRDEGLFDDPESVEDEDEVEDLTAEDPDPWEGDDEEDWQDQEEELDPWDGDDE